MLVPVLNFAVITEDGLAAFPLAGFKAGWNCSEHVKKKMGNQTPEWLTIAI